MNCAGAADPFAASIFRAGQTEEITKDPEQRRVGFGFDGAGSIIDPDCVGRHGARVQTVSSRGNRPGGAFSSGLSRGDPCCGRRSSVLSGSCRSYKNCKLYRDSGYQTAGGFSATRARANAARSLPGQTWPILPRRVGEPRHLPRQRERMMVMVAQWNEAWMAFHDGKPSA